jgi:hypothetical protein
MTPLHSHWKNHPNPQQDLFCLPIFWFCRRKKNKMTALFVWDKDIAQKNSLWNLHVCMYYNTNWFISSIFFHFTLLPFSIFQYYIVIYIILYI